MSNPPARARGTLARPDCTIAYEVTGAGQGPSLIFAHGLGGNHMSWYQQVAHFAPTHRCVTFSHRGFLPSTMPPGGPDPSAYAGDLAALVAHLGLADHVLVAQSMGGWTSVEYGLTKPKGLKGIVLAATAGTVDPKRAPAAYQERLAMWQAASAKTLPDWAAAGIHPAAGARMAREQPAANLLYGHINDVNAALDKEALRQKLMTSRHRAPEEIAGIPCPVLMLANDEDLVIPPVALEAVAATCANARYIGIAEAGHSGYFERPAVFNRIVAEFLAGL